MIYVSKPDLNLPELSNFIPTCDSGEGPRSANNLPMESPPLELQLHTESELLFRACQAVSPLEWTFRVDITIDVSGTRQHYRPSRHCDGNIFLPKAKLRELALRD